MVPAQSQSFVAGVGMLLLTLAVGFTFGVRRLYNMTLSTQPLTLSAEEWKEWQEEHKDHADSTALFYERRDATTVTILLFFLWFSCACFCSHCHEYGW